MRWLSVAGMLAGTLMCYPDFAQATGAIIFKKFTVAERVAAYGPRARARLEPFYLRAGLPYPQPRFLLVAFKRERELHLFAKSGDDEPWTFIREYSILAASGRLGPKLREGDRQVPEGIYRIVGLNPNSRFHLSLRINYPNRFDRKRGRAEGRSDLGSDIMIHGDAVSAGCLAMGDAVAEELFVLAADVGLETAQIVISPVDFRTSALPEGYSPSGPWEEALYAELRRVLDDLPTPGDASSPSDSDTRTEAAKLHELQKGPQSGSRM